MRISDWSSDVCSSDLGVMAGSRGCFIHWWILNVQWLLATLLQNCGRRVNGWQGQDGFVVCSCNPVNCRMSPRPSLGVGRAAGHAAVLSSRILLFWRYTCILIPPFMYATRYVAFPTGPSPASLSAISLQTRKSVVSGKSVSVRVDHGGR